MLNTNKYIAILFILAVANVLLYWPGSLYFLNDDFVHIPLTNDGVLFQQRSIRPIHELLVKFDLWLWQKNAFGFHLTALLLHALVTVQLFYVTKTLQIKYFNVTTVAANQTAFVASCLFLLYPQHAESLAWILGRTPTMAAIFFMALIQLFLQRTYSILTYIGAFLLFSLTLFTYEQSILFPVIFFVLAYAQKNKTEQRSILFFAISTSIAAMLYVVARKLITTEIVGAYEGGNFSKIALLLGNMVRLFFRLFLNPSTIQVFSFFAGLLIIVFVAIAWLHKKELLNKKWLLFVLVLFVLIIPVVSLGVTVRSFESGRYLYFPSIFLVIGLAIYIQQQIVVKPKLVNMLLVLVAFYWGWGKYQSAQSFITASAYS
ncbi:MAG: glucosyltransferase domain-containing protein, partial [Chitinophagaceae bacterium]|nr:glucosyltransferase domain-containing protein [Chitinophagaceae bacterium]